MGEQIKSVTNDWANASKRGKPCDQEPLMHPARAAVKLDERRDEHDDGQGCGSVGRGKARKGEERERVSWVAPFFDMREFCSLKRVARSGISLLSIHSSPF